MWSRVTLLALAVITGCGNGEEPEPSRVAPPSRDARAYEFYERHPYALTCGHVLAIHSAKAQQFHIAAMSLAREVRLPGTNRNEIWARFVHGLLEICKSAGDRSHRPAREAVRRVRRGEFALRGGPP
jgi:hypothetical protein